MHIHISIQIRIAILVFLAILSLVRLFEFRDMMTLCATIIVWAALVLTLAYEWRERKRPRTERRHNFREQ